MNIIYPGTPFELPEGSNGFDVAKAVDPEKKNKALAYKLGEKEHDMNVPLAEGGELSFVMPDSPEGFEMMNHSCSHLMAQALLHLYPGCHFGYGPALEEGFYYDVDFGDRVLTDKDFPAIEAEMKRLSKEAIPYRRKEVSREEALEVFKSNPYKVEHIKELEGPISLYEQGDFVDLCRGPHVPNTSYLKHFKLLSLAGAYWKGDSSRKQLTRIYATCWPSKEALKNHLEILERRKANDHRRLGKELGLFMLSDMAPGMPFFLPKGQIVMNELISYWRKIHTRLGYNEITTPTMMSRRLWETSGHWDHYKDNMYTTKIDDETFCIKPMNCPGSILVYGVDTHSYKELPIKLGELGIVHRHERSGTLHGLMRVRCFTQDDAHIYMTEEQITEEITNVVRVIDEVYSKFGFKYHVELSTRPEDSMGSDEDWERATNGLINALKSCGLPYVVNEGDGAFYGPKIDFHLEDSIGRTWQCGTIQLDFQMPQRFDISYIGADGEKHRPVMAHRVVFGSIERFIGILIEHYAGRFPTWLSPVQVKVLSVSEKSFDYAAKVSEQLKAAGIRVELDNRDEKIGYKIREAQLEKVPYMLILGEKESEDGGIVAVRSRDKGDLGAVPTGDFIAQVRKEIDDRS